MDDNAFRYARVRAVTFPHHDLPRWVTGKLNVTICRPFHSV